MSTTTLDNTIVVLARCADCNGLYRVRAGGWECVGCGAGLGRTDLVLEADEHPVDVVDADVPGQSLLGYVKVAETWTEGNVVHIAPADANLGGWAATEEYGPVQITGVYPDAQHFLSVPDGGLALAQFSTPADPGGLVTYCFVIAPA